ncbi:MAG: septal ring lytic transglycosylase RlpA family protein [Nitrospiraceae bacterium]|nr:MAG: septal ring lytic transglycosylase RlpA family protein [Nitrospiraceae bacterium]
MMIRYKLIKHSAIFLLTILLSSCASLAPVGYRPPAEGYVTASWYGQDFHGRPTSSGERYDMYGLTCAHKEMDFGTKLRVTNPDSNKSVVVIVNDRGPFIPGRDLDLSYGAAREIDFANKGVGLVKIEHLGRDMRYVKRIEYSPSLPAGALTIQVGSFIDKSNADRLKQGLEIKYSDVYLTTFLKDNQTFYRVRIGRFGDREGAYTTASRLANEGYTTLIVSYN